MSVDDSLRQLTTLYKTCLCHTAQYVATFFSTDNNLGKFSKISIAFAKELFDDSKR